MGTKLRFDVFFATAILFSALPILAQRITVHGTRFEVGGKQIWLNGANTPWHRWNDFGTGNYDHAWWDSHMQTLNDSGINCIRVWISCNGGGIQIGSDGTVIGVTSTFFSDLDRFFSIAQSHKIYIFATLLSFDHTKNGNPRYQAFRACYMDDAKTGTLVDNYVVPFVNRYRQNPYLFAIDACNEIEWVHEDAEAGNIAWERLQYLVARMAVGVHEAGPVLFTMGSAAVKWNSDKPGQGNQWKDSALRLQLDDPRAFLDFYSPHWYGWVVRWFGNPCVLTPAGYGIGDRPCVIGECPAKGMFNQDAQGNDILVNPPAEMYEKAYLKGWQGVFPWTSNGVDGNGGLANFSAATRTFRDNHPELVDPSATAVRSELEQSSEPSRLSCFPNPFNGRTAVQYRLDQPGKVRLRIHDVNGRLRRLLVETEQSRGEFVRDWNGCDDRGNPLPSGMYLCCLSLEKEQLVSKVLMAR